MADVRVKLQPFEYVTNPRTIESGVSEIIENSPILKPYLGKGQGTLGVIFPYTPVFALSANAQYNTYQTTHSNYNVLSYAFSNISPITLTAQFTCGTAYDSQYSLAVIHFFRTVTKSRFGIDDKFSGAPPPLLKFSAYGDLIIKNAPVVVSNFTMTFSDDVDYVDVFIPNTTFKSRIPVIFTVSIELMPQYLPNKQFKEFDITEFAKGNLINDKGFI
tara:strand:+ start:6118 stop:6768 length:651 start_codon:yes stop_codon:yes gene_type:complete